MRRSGLVLLLVAAVVVGILVGRNLTEDTSPTTRSTSSTTPPTDLTILSATVQRAAEPDICGGYTLCLLVTAANWGPVDVTGLNDGCGTPSFGDPQPFAAYALDSVIPADTTVTFRSGYRNLEPHLPATFTLICEIDATNRINETNETNNIYTTEVTL